MKDYINQNDVEKLVGKPENVETQVDPIMGRMTFVKSKVTKVTRGTVNQEINSSDKNSQETNVRADEIEFLLIMNLK